jgi:HEAT repeat protein
MRLLKWLVALAALGLSAAQIGNLVGYSRQARVDRLVNEMLSGDRCLDVELLRQMGPQVMPPLIKALSTKHSALEQSYAVLRCALPNYVSCQLPELLVWQTRRLNAAAFTGLLGPMAESATPALITLLKDDIADANAANSLAIMGPRAQQAVPALLIALQEHRPFAATALGSIGNQENAEPAMEAAFHEDPGWFQNEARLALKRLHVRNAESYVRLPRITRV